MAAEKLKCQRKWEKTQCFPRDAFQRHAMGILVLDILKTVLFSGDLLVMPI